MEFACSVCQYTSARKSSVIRHINRKQSCGPGTKTVVEIPINAKCEFCSRQFSTIEHLSRHQKDNCLKKLEILEKQLKEEKNKNKELERQLREKPTTINNTYNIMINNYENTSLEKLTDRIYNNLINDANEPYNIIPKLIEEVHFNPEMPENHNICISNKGRNNKHLNIYRNGHWEIKNKDTEIDNLISDKDTMLSDWIEEKGEKYPDALEKFNDYLNQKYDEDIAKLVKEEVEQLLYNKKHMVKGPA